MKTLLAIVMGGGMLACAGCGGTRPVQERSWIGGEYEAARAEGPGGACGVLVTRLGEGTPAARAGLREGDLVLALDGMPVEDPSSLWQAVDAGAPGSPLRASIWRAGEAKDLAVLRGRERYERWGHVAVGLWLESNLDLLPDPGFSLFGLIALGTGRDRLEFADPRVRLARRAAGGEAPPVDSREGFRMRLLILSFGRHLRILSQEA